MNIPGSLKIEAPVLQHRHPREVEKAEWVRRFQQSKLSLREFTAQNDVGYSHVSMWRWVNQVRGANPKNAPQSAPAQIDFTEIKLEPPDEQPQWVAELSLPDGRVLRVSKDVPASMLEQLLGAC